MQKSQICKIIALAEREAGTSNGGTANEVDGEDLKTKLKLARLMVTRKWTKMLKTRELFVFLAFLSIFESPIWPI